MFYRVPISLFEQVMVTETQRPICSLDSKTVLVQSETNSVRIYNLNDRQIYKTTDLDNNTLKGRKKLDFIF